MEKLAHQFATESKDYRIVPEFRMTDNAQAFFAFRLDAASCDKFDTFYSKIEGKDMTTSVLQQYLFENMDEDNIMKNIKDLIKYIEENNYDKREVNMYM